MAEDPQYTWTKYQVNVHGGNKTYDNFRKAWYQQVEIEKSTTETEIEEHEVLRHKRTKKMPSLKNKSVFDVSDESDNSRNSDSCFDVMASSSNQHFDTPDQNCNNPNNWFVGYNVFSILFLYVT
eukprot:XP_016664894.1 PREDICTED: uncharacterized protein LOC100571756 [Acyrthosiphon pisum]